MVKFITCLSGRDGYFVITWDAPESGRILGKEDDGNTERN